MKHEIDNSQMTNVTVSQMNNSYSSQLYKAAAKPKKTTAAKAAAETCRSDEPAEFVWEADAALELEVPDLPLPVPEEPEEPEPVAVAVTKPVLVEVEPLVGVPVAEDPEAVVDLIT